MAKDTQENFYHFSIHRFYTVFCDDTIDIFMEIVKENQKDRTPKITKSGRLKD